MLRSLRRAAAPMTCVALASCAGGDDERAPDPIRGAPQEVAAVIGDLERATRGGDYEAICRDLFTATARRRSGGRECARLLRTTGRGVRSPRIELLAIRVQKDRAEARVRTRASGQKPLEDVIVLRREGGRYRIDSLG